MYKIIIYLTRMLGILIYCSSIIQLISLITGAVVVMIDKSHLQQLTLQCRRLLMDKPHHRMPVKEFQPLYVQYYAKACNMDELKQTMSNVVRVSSHLILPIVPFNIKNLKAIVTFVFSFQW